jgi:hypothetical protein
MTDSTKKQVTYENNCRPMLPKMTDELAVVNLLNMSRNERWVIVLGRKYPETRLHCEGSSEGWHHVV